MKSEQIKENWDIIINTIEKEISSPRKEKLLKLFNNLSELLIILPYNYKPQYIGCYPGGWLQNLSKLLSILPELYSLWVKNGVVDSTFNYEELIFSALTYDLYKTGTNEGPLYVPNTNEWEIKNRDLKYVYNDKLQFMSSIDRTILLLNTNEIEFSENELLAIRLHAGLNDENNSQYFQSFIPQARPRTSLVYILSQGIEITNRILFEQEFFPKFKEEKVTIKTVAKTSTKKEAVGIILGNAAQNTLKNILKG